MIATNSTRCDPPSIPREPGVLHSSTYSMYDHSGSGFQVMKSKSIMNVPDIMYIQANGCNVKWNKQQV